MRASALVLLLAVEHAAIAVVLLLVPATTWNPVLLLFALWVSGVTVALAIVVGIIEGRTLFIESREPLVDRLGENQ